MAAIETFDHCGFAVQDIPRAWSFYQKIYPKLERYGCYLEGDALAGRRAPGHKSVYFYDPSGNRLQLIILPPGGDGRARA